MTEPYQAFTRPEDQAALPPQEGAGAFDGSQVPEALGMYQEGAFLEAPDVAMQSQQPWLMRHKKLGLAVAGTALALAAGGALVHFNKKADHDAARIARDIPAAGYALPVTEGAAWGGFGIMLLAAGSEIGNPLDMKKRIKPLIPAVKENHVFRVGYGINVSGAIGTAAVWSVGAVMELPKQAWPVAFVVSASSIVLSGIPFARQMRRDKPEAEEEGNI